MKKQLLTVSLIILFFSIQSGNAQNYFSKRYFFNNTSSWAFSTNIITEPFGYTLQIQDGSLSNPDQYRLGFLRLDSLGNKLSFEKIYQYDSISLCIEYGGSFIKLSQNNGYAIAGLLSQWVITGRYDQGILMRFDGNLDTLWTKLFTDTPPHDTSLMFMNCRELSDNGFIITGMFGRIDGNGFPPTALLKVDSIGTLIWQKKYGPNGTTMYYAQDVTNTSDGGYAIGAQYCPYNSNTQGADPLLIKVDSLGNQQWLKHFGNPVCRDDAAMVDQALDGNIQVGTVYSDTCEGNGEYLSRINFIKIRNNQEIVWDKKYGLSKYWNSLKKIIVLKNGDLTGTGDYWKGNSIGTFVITSWIIKTDSAGNEQWYREYEIVNGENSENHLYDIKKTTDKGIAACGYIVPAPPDTGFENSWVLKVDSLGCESPGNCWVGNTEIRIKTFTPKKPYVVYPNPSTEKITIEFHENNSGADIEIYDQYSRECFKSSIEPNKDRLDIDIGQWQTGLYFVKVFLDEKILGIDKIIKM